MFSKLLQMIKMVVRKILPYKDIESVEHLESPVSTEMAAAADLWYLMYLNKAPWLKADTVHSLNLPALICSELARLIMLEMEWNISGPQDENGKEIESPRAAYLKAEFEKLYAVLRSKLEQGCAAGGMTIKPYPKNGHIYFDCTMNWSLFPIAFGSDGSSLVDVVFRDAFTEGRTIYTRLERHTLQDNGDIRVTQRAFRSQVKNSIGVEIPLSSVPQWSNLASEAIVKGGDGQMFGWFKPFGANNVDVDSPMGVSVFSKATDLIKQADLQYSRILWEYEGSELAIDVDPTVLRPKKDGNGKELPRLNERLFRGVDTGNDGGYNVFNPEIRDASLFAGLSQLLMRIEDLCGIARGTLGDLNQEARTATELKQMKQRTYDTVTCNQSALEQCLRDVVRVMDRYATLYKLCPEGEYELSFNWGDSIDVDTEQLIEGYLELLDRGIISEAQFRKWFFGETDGQALAALEKLVSKDRFNQLIQGHAVGAVKPEEITAYLLHMSTEEAKQYVREIRETEQMTLEYNTV